MNSCCGKTAQSLCLTRNFPLFVHRMQSKGWMPAQLCCAGVLKHLAPVPQPCTGESSVCVSVILWRPAVISVVLVTSWSASSIAGSFTSLTLLLFCLCTKMAAPGNFFPGMLRVLLAILCDLHPLVLTLEFGLRARGGRLMNSHYSITSDRAFPCTLQLPGCPLASRLKYDSMLLSTAVESGNAGGISSSRGWAGVETFG